MVLIFASSCFPQYIADSLTTGNMHVFFTYKFTGFTTVLSNSLPLNIDQINYYMTIEVCSHSIVIASPIISTKRYIEI